MIFISALMTHVELLKAIGGKVKKCRKHFGFSRRELAEKSGVSIATITRLENEGVATISVLVKIANALGVSETLEGIFKTPEYKSIDEYLRAEDEKS
jgi:transcriptional regulator with XRE-family HTH domain